MHSLNPDALRLDWQEKLIQSEVSPWSTVMYMAHWCSLYKLRALFTWNQLTILKYQISKESNSTFLCVKNYIRWLIPRPNSCMGASHSKPLSQLIPLIWPMRTLESCVPLAGCACVIGFGLLSRARDRVEPFRLPYPAHGSVSACPCLCAGVLTTRTLMTWPVIIIFPWSPKCTWNKAMINLCYRTYSRLNGHAVIELYVKWSTNTTKRHNSQSVLCINLIALGRAYSVCSWKCNNIGLCKFPQKLCFLNLMFGSWILNLPLYFTWRKILVIELIFLFLSSCIH